MSLAVVILAAGAGHADERVTCLRYSTRRRGVPLAQARPCERSILLEPQQVVVVTGYKAEEVEAKLSGEPVQFVRQREQLGTGHALLQSKEVLENFDGSLTVLNGDGPLLKTETLRNLEQTQQCSNAGMTLLTCKVKDPTGLGRIIRNEDGSVWLKLLRKKTRRRLRRQLTRSIPAFSSSTKRFSS